MKTLLRTNGIGKYFNGKNDTFFGRGIDDILTYNFFNSFDVNMREDGNSYLLEIAVPGMRRSDITVQVEGSMMTVAAQKRERKGSWHAVEFNGLTLQRSFALPEDADRNAIKATCREGLLTIRIGKDRKSHRAIKIQVAETNKKRIDNVTSWWDGIKSRVNLFKRTG